MADCISVGAAVPVGTGTRVGGAVATGLYNGIRMGSSVGIVVLGESVCGSVGLRVGFLDFFAVYDVFFFLFPLLQLLTVLTTSPVTSLGKLSLG